MPSFYRSGGGELTAVLEPAEARLLVGLPAQVRELIEAGTGQVHDRLFPRAYLDPTEDAAEREWQELSHADLLAGKVAALEVFEETLGEVTEGHENAVRVILDEETSASWLGALNDLRLALGVLLDVTEDLDIARVRPEDPRAPGLHLYGFLTWVQGELIDAVSS